jgi:hypothetical protein
MAFQIIVQGMGFGCTKVTGKSDYNACGEVNHAWNLIEIDGKFYHVDLTWDINNYSTSREYSYNWFLLSDDEILDDHSWNVNSTPPSTDDSQTYYRRNGLVADNEREAIAIFMKTVKNPSIPVRMKCSQNFWSSKPMKEYLSQLLRDTALKHHSGIRMMFTYNEKTGCFFARIEV